MNAIVNPDEVRKAVVDSLSNPSDEIARHVLSMAGANPSQIEKAITTGSGLVAYDLQAPAKNLAYVTAQADAHCTVPAGFIRMHDDAANGLPPVSFGPGQLADAPSGLALSSVAATVA